MVKIKEKENIIKLADKQQALRIVQERSGDRRQQQSGFSGEDQRRSDRRQADLEARERDLEMLRRENERLQMRNSDLVVSRPELVLYYVSLLLSVNVIFGWMAYLALFVK